MAHTIGCASCKGTHETVAQVRLCHHDMAELDRQADEAAGEIYAEAVMSWVAGGGSSADGARYASWVIAHPGQEWDGGLGEPPADEGECRHGLSAALCQDPDGEHHWGTLEQEMADPANW